MKDDDLALDAILAEQEHGYLDDDGFSARVVAALPPKRAPSRIRVVTLLLASSAAASVALWSPVRELVLRAPLDVATLHVGATVPIVSIVVVALALWGAWGAAATAE